MPLQTPGRIEADRLEELRLALFETWAEAQLALRRPEQVVVDLRPLVERHPYRERLVAQLMVALYRCGRQVEALEEYERLRTALDEALGLQPAAELQRLSARIVRQDAGLGAAPAAVRAVRRVAPRRRRRLLLVLALAFVVAAAAASSLVVVAGVGKGGAHAPSARVALVVPQDPGASPRDAVLTSVIDGLRRAERDYGVKVETLVADEFDAEAPSVRRMLGRLRSRSFGLVLVFGGLVDAVAPLAKASPSTRFVFFDRGLDAPNATTITFADEDAGYLAGYLSGLVEASRDSRLNKEHVVAMIGGVKGAGSVENLLAGFAKGIRKALPDAGIMRDYSQDFANTSRCETIANRQIDAGADIVFAAAGRCSLGSLSAAAIRRVWAVGVDADQSYLGDHVLVSTVKRYDQAAFHVVRAYAQGSLRAGKLRLGLRDEAVGIAGIGASVPDQIRRRVAHLALAMTSRDRQ